jgi:hypothetical protein
VPKGSGQLCGWLRPRENAAERGIDNRLEPLAEATVLRGNPPVEIHIAQRRELASARFIGGDYEVDMFTQFGNV